VHGFSIRFGDVASSAIVAAEKVAGSAEPDNATTGNRSPQRPHRQWWLDHFEDLDVSIVTRRLAFRSATNS
jgi:hypothetical protein